MEGEKQVGKVTKVELGCGTTKNEGYLGIDRFPLPNVDIVADLDKGIPLEDNSVEVIFCSHSLEHFENLPNIVNEIYRVCKHKAIVNVLAPYHMETVNLANFYHKQVFNEATFRFFTNEEKTHININDYYNPHASLWGLASSDNSNNKVNIVTLNMEYFYYPGYESLSDGERRNARKSLINVCDQIYYSLAVNKSEKAFTDEEIEELRLMAKIEEVPNINIIRNRSLDNKLGSSIIEDIKKWDKEIQEEFKRHVQENELNISKGLLEMEQELKQKISEVVNENEGFRRELQESQRNITQSLIEVEQKFKEKINSIASDNLEQIKHIEKIIDDKLEDLNAENYKIVANLQDQLNFAKTERNSLAVITLDLIKSTERSSFINKYFSMFKKNRDLFKVISVNYTYFCDGLILLNDNFSKNSIVRLSKIIPFDGYFEYKLCGYGNKINFFLFSNIGANIFLETVLNGKIVKQESITVNYEGIYSCLLPESVRGELYIRFRTLDNVSICRLVEIVNRRRCGSFEKRSLAGFIE